MLVVLATIFGSIEQGWQIYLILAVEKARMAS